MPQISCRRIKLSWCRSINTHTHTHAHTHTQHNTHTHTHTHTQAVDKFIPFFTVLLKEMRMLGESKVLSFLLLVLIRNAEGRLVQNLLV